MAWLQVLGPLEKGLRSAAELGAWQLISPVDARGRVLLVDGLHEIQDEVRAMCLIRSILFSMPRYTCTQTMHTSVVCHMFASISCEEACLCHGSNWPAAVVPALQHRITDGACFPALPFSAPDDAHWLDLCRGGERRRMWSRR